MKAGLVLLIFRQLLLNDSMARIFFSQMMLFVSPWAFLVVQFLKSFCLPLQKTHITSFQWEDMFSFFQLVTLSLKSGSGSCNRDMN